jgi:hypothetical protein
MAGRKVQEIDLSRPRKAIVANEDPVKAVREIYTVGRHYPHGKPHERSYPKSPATPQWPGHTAGHGKHAGLADDAVLDPLSPLRQLPQAPEDRLAPTYRNDVAPGYLRGMKPNATSG